MAPKDNNKQCGGQLCNEVTRAITLIEELNPLAKLLQQYLTNPETGLIVLYVKMQGELDAIKQNCTRECEQVRAKLAEKDSWSRDVKLILVGSIFGLVGSVIGGIILAAAKAVMAGASAPVVGP